MPAPEFVSYFVLCISYFRICLSRNRARPFSAPLHFLSHHNAAAMIDGWPTARLRARRSTHLVRQLHPVRFSGSAS